MNKKDRELLEKLRRFVSLKADFTQYEDRLLLDGIEQRLSEPDCEPKYKAVAHAENGVLNWLDGRQFASEEVLYVQLPPEAV